MSCACWHKQTPLHSPQRDELSMSSEWPVWMKNSNRWPAQDRLVSHVPLNTSPCVVLIQTDTMFLLHTPSHRIVQQWVFNIIRVLYFTLKFSVWTLMIFELFSVQTFWGKYNCQTELFLILFGGPTKPLWDPPSRTPSEPPQWAPVL